MKKGIEIVFVVLFFALCLIPGLGMLILPEEENHANQVLAAEPDLLESDGSLNLDFFTEFQDYFADHFAFRQELITLNADFLDMFFQTSNTDQVIVGENDWLYYESTLDDYLNIPTLTARSAANAAISLSLMQEYAQKNGATLLFMVAPNKNSLYDENMPDRYVPLEQDGNWELMQKAMAAEGVNYLDLFALFDSSDEIMYHAEDSHWNNMGAAYVQKAIMDAFGLEGTDYSQREYEVREDFKGDLYEMLFPMGDGMDENQYYGDFTYVTDAEDTEAMRYEAVNTQKEHGLILYRDSFGNSLAPFMAEEFGYSLALRSVPYDLDEIAAHEADYAVIEMVERHLDTLATRAAVMEAPQRDIEVPETAIEAQLTCEAAQSGEYWMLTGSFDAEQTDIGSRVYAVLGDGTDIVVYEATPAGGDGEGSFTLYIPQDTSYTSISLVVMLDETLVSTETIEIAYS